MEVDIKILVVYAKTLVSLGILMAIVLIIGMAFITNLLDQILRKLKE